MGQRAKAKVKSKVLQKQEEKVKQLELRNSQLEREARKFWDCSALLQVEKKGWNNGGRRPLESWRRMRPCW